MGILNDMPGPGLFGKMLPDLTPFRPPGAALIPRGAAMKEDPSEGNSSIPAGFTCLGQFIDVSCTSLCTDQAVSTPNTTYLRAEAASRVLWPGIF